MMNRTVRRAIAHARRPRPSCVRAPSASCAAAKAVQVRALSGGHGEDKSLKEYWKEFKERTEGLPSSEFSKVAKDMKKEYLDDAHHSGAQIKDGVEYTDEDYPVTRNPGLEKAGEMPTDSQQATGPEYEEITAAAEGELLFSRDPLTGPFGTMDAPVRVPSSFEQRVVGCLGGPGDANHPLLWFALYRGRKHACPRCGQVFEMVDATGDMQADKSAAAASAQH